MPAGVQNTNNTVLPVGHRPTLSQVHEFWASTACRVTPEWEANLISTELEINDLFRETHQSTRLQRRVGDERLTN